MNKNLAHVKVGDRVWVEGRYESQKRIQTVARLTPKQIILDGHFHSGANSEFNCYWRGRKRTYSPDPDYSQARRWSSDCIIGIATKAECAEYDKKEAEKARQEEARQREADEREARRGELQALFRMEHAYVRREPNNTAGEYSLTLYGNESDLRQWAERLKGGES